MDENDKRNALAGGATHLGFSMIQENTNESLVIYSDLNGDYHFACTSITWGLGALTRAKRDLERTIEEKGLKSEEE